MKKFSLIPKWFRKWKNDSEESFAGVHNALNRIENKTHDALSDIENVLHQIKTDKKIEDANVHNLFIICLDPHDIIGAERVLKLYTGCNVKLVYRPEHLHGSVVKHYIVTNRAHENKYYNEMMHILRHRIR